MKLTKVAGFFNRTIFNDAYDPDITFKGRLMPFEDATRDSLSTERRLLTVRPGVEIPTDRTIQCDGDTYLVGSPDTDMHRNEALREKFVLHKADSLATVATFVQALQQDFAHQVWASRLWIKAGKEVDESSGEYSGYSLFFSETARIRDEAADAARPFTDGRESNVLVVLGGRYHLVRATYTSAAGFLVAVSDELPGPVLNQVQFFTRVYDPISDTDADTSVNINAINLRWQSFFKYGTRYSDKYLNGDSQLIVLKSAITPKAGDLVTVTGLPYKVVSVNDDDLCWAVHVRRA